MLFHNTITITNNVIRRKKDVLQLICLTVRDSFVEMTNSVQVQLQNHPVVERVWVTMSPGAYQKFAIFVVEILDGNTAEYKPCAQFEGRFHEQLVRFECNEGRGSSASSSTSATTAWTGSTLASARSRCSRRRRFPTVASPRSRSTPR